MFERHLIKMCTFNYLGLKIESDYFSMKSFMRQKENKHRICDDDNHRACMMMIPMEKKRAQQQQQQQK